MPPRAKFTDPPETSHTQLKSSEGSNGSLGAESGGVPLSHALELAESGLRDISSFLAHARHAFDAERSAHSGENIDPHVLCERVFMRRQTRALLFGADLFSDPAWDILLLLFTQPARRTYLPTGEISLAGLPKTTTLRWLEVLEGRGLIWRGNHPADELLRPVGLTQQARDLLIAYFSCQGFR